MQRHVASTKVWINHSFVCLEGENAFLQALLFRCFLVTENVKNACGWLGLKRGICEACRALMYSNIACWKQRATCLCFTILLMSLKLLMWQYSNVKRDNEHCSVHILINKRYTVWANKGYFLEHYVTRFPGSQPSCLVHKGSIMEPIVWCSIGTAPHWRNSFIKFKPYLLGIGYIGPEPPQKKGRANHSWALDT